MGCYYSTFTHDGQPPSLGVECIPALGLQAEHPVASRLLSPVFAEAEGLPGEIKSVSISLAMAASPGLTPLTVVVMIY